MKAAGIAIEIPTRHRPIARMVVLDDSSGQIQIASVNDFTADDTDLATQLHDMGEAIRSRLAGLRVDRVVIRRADVRPVPSNAEGPKLRLLAEGAVASSARSVVPETLIGTGRDTGAWFGSNKESVDAASTALLSANSVSRHYVEATSAALAGLTK